MSVNELIRKMPEAINPAATANMHSTIQYKITQPMYLVIDDGKCTAHDGLAPSPDLSLIISDENLAAMLKGELNGISAFMSGKLKVEGDMMLAQRLPSLFDTSKLS
ncbi:SCP2 sterol-binding domain-containing protein [Noviherbaspirillum massiliense]|uniref:SCP2 sterol-binding domain-containing protein n=1 Tax=Noviherbaspirillum massiliense TaxID=1465823 RepID=UPI00047527CF|nr:SCP2 sterol-binding domain-containing protein [Noviherbaspirillum massiliense]